MVREIGDPKKPSAEPKPKRRRKTGLVTRDDALFKLIGIGSPEGPRDLASNKHKYLGQIDTERQNG